MKFRIILFILISLCILIASVPDSKAQDKKSNYGKTPDEMLPYGRYHNPYKLFFIEPQLFLGPGREKPPPSDLKEVKIGFLGPLEGSSETPMGLQMLHGATLAIEEANEKGGYQGIPFVLLPHNDVGLWGAAANEIVKMDDEGVWAILGSIDGAVTHVALRVALKLEIPMVNTGDSDPTLTETRIPWIIRVLGDDRQSSYALADYMIKQKGYSNIAVLRTNSRYGRVGPVDFRDAVRRLGYPLVLEVRYSDGDTTFIPQLERINNTSADAVLIWGNAKEGGLIVQQMRELGMKQPIFGSDRLVSSEFLEIAGKDAEGLITTYPYNPTFEDPKLQAFNKRYYEKYKQEPVVFAAHAYDGMNILIEAIQIAGLNRVLIRDILTDLKTFQGYEGVTGKIIFDATWNDVGAIWMAKVRHGKFEFFPVPLKQVQ